MPVQKRKAQSAKLKAKTQNPKLKGSIQKQRTAGRKVVAKVESAKPALSVQVYGEDGKATERFALPPEIFNAKINPKLMAQAVRVYLANQRRGTASTKTRGEVRGSTRKIYRQKGTGRARHGAITAPIFVGGGIVFGPTPRDYSLKLSKKMKRKALFSALSLKLKEDNVKVVSIAEAQKLKTKLMVTFLHALSLAKNDKRAEKVLFVLPEKMEEVELALRNIEGLTIEKAHNLSTYHVLKSNQIVFVKDAIPMMSRVFLAQNK